MGDTNMKTVMDWAIGVAGIALLLLIMLILFGNLSGNVGFGNDGTTITVINESAFANPVFANTTGYTLSGFNTTWSAMTITALWNSSSQGAGDGNWNITVPTANAGISSVGVLGNATTAEYSNISVSYTYSHSFPSVGLSNTNDFIGDYTTSVLNTGSQFPVVGTIIGVGLLLFILIALLLFALTKMGRIGAGSKKSHGGNFG